VRSTRRSTRVRSPSAESTARFRDLISVRSNCCRPTKRRASGYSRSLYVLVDEYQDVNYAHTNSSRRGASTEHQVVATTISRSIPRAAATTHDPALEEDFRGESLQARRELPLDAVDSRRGERTDLTTPIAWARRCHETRTKAKKITAFQAESERAEVRSDGRRSRNTVREGRLSDFLVLYRTRPIGYFEEGFLAEGIPTRVAARASTPEPRSKTCYSYCATS